MPRQRLNINPSLDRVNRLLGKRFWDVGSYATFTRGFGLPDDLRVGKRVNVDGGICPEHGGTLKECIAYLDSIADKLEAANGKV